MFFAFGFITLLGFVAFCINRRLSSDWKGESAKRQNQMYDYAVSVNKGKPYRLRLGIACATGFDFCLKPETAIDRFFKGLGLSEEQQVQRLTFDESIYIQSDDKMLGRMLKYNEALRAQLQPFFDSDSVGICRVKKLWCRGGRLWLDCKVKSTFDGMARSHFEDRALPMLTALKTELEQTAPESTGSRDYFFLKAAIFLGISTALAINAGVQLLRLTFNLYPVLIDNAALIRQAVIVGIVMSMVLLGICIKLLGRTSRAHSVFIELLFIGTAGLIGNVYFELRDYNIEFDSSSARSVVTQVTDVYSKRCGKRSTCYFLNLSPVADYPGSSDLKIDWTTFNAFRGSKRAVLKIHDGNLGWRWMEMPTPD